MKKNEGERTAGPEKAEKAELRELKILVPEDLSRAWQRCSWAITCETGRNRTDIMREMVEDFLVKHGC